jgi:hypothetical protein
MIEAKLMAHRSAQHPITTLVSVAADLPVPLLVGDIFKWIYGYTNMGKIIFTFAIGNGIYDLPYELQ